MSEIKQEPSFDDAPQRASSSGGPSLKAPPANYKRLNPKVKNGAIIGAMGIVGLIIFTILNMSDAPAPSAKKENKPAPTTMQGSLPKSLTDAPDGVPSATPSAVPEPAVTGRPESPPVPAVNGPTRAGADPLAEAGKNGNVPGLTGAYPDRAPRAKSEAELIAEREATKRSEALQAGADSALAAGDAPGGGMMKTSMPTGSLGGGVGGVGNGQPSPQVPLSEDPNKQVRKEQFLKDASNLAQLDNVLLQPLKKPLSPYTISAGWLIPSIMVGGLKSDLPGQLRAQVRENVKDTVTGEYTLIPRGSTLVGTYDSQIAFGQSRVLVVWSRVIFPDGSSMNLQGMPGSDEQGYAGLTGDVDNHMWPIVKAAVFMSVISAAAQLSQPQSANSNGSYGAPSAGQTLAAALGQQLGNAGTQLFSRYLNIQPTITTEPGTRFNILVTKDIVFPQAWSWQ
ncbi:TrbI/VirB10 family protein [Caballeronia sp. LP003]|uniref:TrbI/VirB10 family protein n=1 Tax=Caballeronia sp. LP003 TaxID=3038551 RepID=UPI002861A088|nr:TrbI/VirB10 family protein [Caballeronia sp. LP003]MDR5791719.1 TrbI/VirB10 family protein [Caballeronia sp. LP003]